MVSMLVASEDQILWGLMFDSFLDTARSTLVTPWPMLSLMTNRMSRNESSMPRAGKARAIQLNPPLLMTGKTNDCMKSMPLSSRTAAVPAPSPTRKLSRRSLTFSGSFLPTSFIHTQSAGSSSVPYWAILSSGRVLSSGSVSLPAPVTSWFSASSSPSSQRSMSSMSSVLTLILTR